MGTVELPTEWKLAGEAIALQTCWTEEWALEALTDLFVIGFELEAAAIVMGAASDYARATRRDRFGLELALEIVLKSTG